MQILTEPGMVEHLGHNTKTDTEAWKSLFVNYHDPECTMTYLLSWVTSLGFCVWGQVPFSCQNHAGGVFSQVLSLDE